jgi:hypothetical protein
MNLRFAIIAVALLLGTLGASAQPRQQGLQPLTYSNVVSFFKGAGLRATEVQKRCTVFFEGQWTSSNIYNYCLIIVENSDEDVQVTFYLTDAHEMNWVTEFLDAPFFARSETTNLFDLINSGRETRNRRVGRFAVDFHRWEPRHAQILVFSFVPAQKARS